MLLSHYYQGKMEAGCDEAGRGCLAGSVYAAAVIFPEDYENAELNDSKQLTDRRRHQLREVIERDAVAWAVGIVTPEEIDRINILNASILAMHRALDQLAVRPEAIIVDGNRFKPYRPAAAVPTAVPAAAAVPTAVPAAAAVPTAAPVPASPDAAAPVPAVSTAGPTIPAAIPHTTIVKGDAKYLSIAAASILAKTYRDDYMDRLAEEFPQYDWQSNKGYPTKKHREAIRQYGITKYHRRTFNMLGDGQLKLEFK